ncbi:hypothetical protein [Paenibacillus turpanensis]|uniref:hypothetical protein n=1 Tax=Paenibacillus turpanensis TaxID=2689078 RepID=UPI00140AA933|nr:hypothetical protein [Paenibacillus turpanensis]
MKKSFRSVGHWMKAIMFSLLLMVVYTAIQVGAGMFQTITYQPDIAAAYESVDYMQHKVSFGVIYKPEGPWMFLSRLAGGMVLYWVIYWLWTRWRQNRMER